MPSIFPPARRLALAGVLMALGNGAFMTCSAIYFTRVAGLTPTEFGLGLSIAGAVGLVAGVPLGHLADRHGPRGVTATMIVLNGAAALGDLTVRTVPVFVLAACVFVVCQRGSRAALQALIAGFAEGEALVRTQAKLRSANNTGLAVGAALAGIALQIGTSASLSVVVVAEAVSLFASAVMTLSLPSPRPGPSRAAAEQRRSVFRDGPFVVFTAMSAVLSLQFVLLEVILPTWIAGYTKAPPVMVTILFLLNTVAVVAFQVRVGTRVRSMRRAVSAFRLSGFVYLVASGLFALSAVGPMAVRICLLVVAGLVHAWAEMLISAASWTIGFGMAPTGKQGQYQGFYFTGYATTAMIAPALLTLLLIEWGIPGWFLLGVLCFAVSCAVGRVVTWAERPRRGAEPAASPTRAR